MDFSQKILDSFSLDSRSIHELIEISSLIDMERSNNGYLAEKDDELSSIASIIVALLNEKSTFSIGTQLYSTINELIVKKNAIHVDSNNGKKILQKAQGKTSPSTFKIRKTRSGYMFNLVASNGEILASSEVYSSLDSCSSGVQSVQKNALTHVEDQTEPGYQQVKNPKYEIYTDKVGEYRFRLKLSNGQIIAVSEGYKSKETCLRTIDRIKESVESSDIEKG